jgi:parallel beta-helix repeat protein
MGGPFTKGIFSALNDNMVFQSLELNGWPENGIFLSEGDDVAFRDIVGDGEIASLYAVFPVASTNVLVESCEVKNVIDAGVYVGQSVGIISRYNRIYDNVAGQEIENSANSDVYANLHYNNVAGLLIFTLPGPTQQHAGPHTISHNVSTANNLDHEDIPPNGGAVATVPSGTGIILISQDDSDFSYNYSQDNRSFGIAIVDQLVINALAGEEVFDQGPAPPGDPVRHRTTANNHIHHNDIDGNGFAPDDDGPNATPFGADYILLTAEPGSVGNCVEDVKFGEVFLDLNDQNDCP